MLQKSKKQPDKKSHSRKKSVWSFEHHLLSQFFADLEKNEKMKPKPSGLWFSLFCTMGNWICPVRPVRAALEAQLTEIHASVCGVCVRTFSRQDHITWMYLEPFPTDTTPRITRHGITAFVVISVLIINSLGAHLSTRDVCKLLGVDFDRAPLEIFAFCLACKLEDKSVCVLTFMRTAVFVIFLNAGSLGGATGKDTPEIQQHEKDQSFNLSFPVKWIGQANGCKYCET